MRACPELFIAIEARYWAVWVTPTAGLMSLHIGGYIIQLQNFAGHHRQDYACLFPVVAGLVLALASVGQQALPSSAGLKVAWLLSLALGMVGLWTGYAVAREEARFDLPTAYAPCTVIWCAAAILPTWALMDQASGWTRQAEAAINLA